METKIYRKSQGEIDKEQALLNFATQIAKTHAEKACEYYIINKNGVKVNTTALSTVEIVIIAMNNKNLEIKQYIEKDQYIKTFTTLQEVMALSSFAKTPESQSLLADVIGSLGGNKLLYTAKNILHYEKDIKGVETNLNEIIANLATFEKENKQENQ